MHRTLKEDTTKPPALTLRLQQKRLDNSGRSSTTNDHTRESTTRPLQVSTNAVRPYSQGHWYRSPTREDSDQTCEYERRHQLAQRSHIHQSGVLVRRTGLEEMEEDIFSVYFRDMELGELDVTELRFRPVRPLP